MNTRLSALCRKIVAGVIISIVLSFNMFSQVAYCDVKSDEVIAKSDDSSGTSGSSKSDDSSGTSGSSNSSSDDSIRFKIGESSYSKNGVHVDMEAASFIEDGRTFIPVRYLAQSLGVSESNIKWNNASMEVTLVKGSTTLIMKIGSNILNINGVTSNMDVSPTIRNSRTLLPARYVANAFGYAVQWDDSIKSVIIKSSSNDDIIVKMEGFKFVPETITIAKGNTVKWINNDSVIHRIVGFGIVSKSIESGDDFSHTFTESGTFNYRCDIHPGMTGTVIVK
jgi:plastocyanin